MGRFLDTAKNAKTASKTNTQFSNPGSMFNTEIKLKTMIYKLYNRRRALSVIACFAVTTACTPLKVIFSKKKPVDGICDQTLISFTEVIIPGVKTGLPGLTNIYYDPYYPFSRYLNIFIEALNKASIKEFNSEKFSELPIEKREVIVEGMLSKAGIIGQFTTGALFLAQLSFYTGLSNSEGCCELIDFKCMDSETESYPDLANYIEDPQTRDGNPS